MAETTRTPSSARVVHAALEAAEEFGLPAPDAMTGEFMEFLGARAAGNSALTGSTPTAIIMSPACGVIGLHLFRGMHSAILQAQEAGEDLTPKTTDGMLRGSAGSHPRAHGSGHITCIEPEIQHQKLARSAFQADGIPNNAYRFLPSAPLDVVSRLAQNSYDIAIVECSVEDFSTTVEATLPALRPGGILMLLDSLMDGTVRDRDRQDRQITSAREADEAIRRLPGAAVSRLPLGAGSTLVTKL